MSNFFLITIRRLLKEKFYALICVLSLALGIASALLIALYLQSELTYDHYHENHRSINRLITRIANVQVAISGDDVGPSLVQDFPQFSDYVRFRSANESRFVVGDNSNSWEEVYLVDPAVLEHFTVVPVFGDPSSALTEPFSIAISESFSDYYFGRANTVGEVVSTARYDFQVTLVYEDLPQNVTQKYDALIPYSMLEVYQPELREGAKTSFFPTDARTYLVSNSSISMEEMDEISNLFFENYLADQTGAAPDFFGLSLQVLSDIHFSQGVTLDEEATGNIVNIYLFSALAIVLVAVSCINYINLATARAASRVREVAMKKILGADRSSLIGQFLIESLVFVLLAIVLTLVLAQVALGFPTVQNFSGFNGLGDLLSEPLNVGLIIVGIVLIAFIAGIYPAIYLSRQEILSAFRSNPRSWRSGLPVRQVLVFAQMAASVIIVSCVFIMLQQAEFVRESPLGFTRDNRLVVELQGADVIRAREAVMAELNQHNNIDAVSVMGRAIGRGLSIGVQNTTNGRGEEITLTTNSFRVGADILETLEIELIDGTTFRSEKSESDTRPVIVNQALASFMQWEEPIGAEYGRSQVVGVVRDFHFMSLHQPIENLNLVLFDDSYLDNLPESERATTTLDLVIALRNGFDQETRNYIESVVRSFSDQAVIEMLTFNEVWEEMYEDDNQDINLVVFFSMVSVFISLLGLTGLAAFSSEQRRKEVAIRKVVGAPVDKLLLTLSTGMLKMIGLSIIPAFVIAYYAASVWLERFAYQADFSLFPYLIAAAVVIFCSIITLLLQTYRTASSNPVDYLKYE